MIKFQCSHCQQKIGVPETYAGKRVRCAKCRQPIRVPDAQQAAEQQKSTIIKIHCPNCNQKIGVPQKYAGKRVRCAKCKNPLSVPELPAKPPKEKVTAETSGGDQMFNDMMWSDDILAAASTTEASAPAAEEQLKLKPPTPLPQTQAQARCPLCGALKRADSEFCPNCTQGTTSRRERSPLSGAVRIPLAIVCGLGFTLVVAIIWAWVSSLFGILWFDFVDIMVILVIAAGAFGLVLVTQDHRVAYGLLGALIGLIGGISGKALIAKWVIMPRLMPAMKKGIETGLAKLAGEEISDKAVQNALQDHDTMFALTLMQLVDDGEFEEKSAKDIVIARMKRQSPPQLQEQTELAEVKVRECLESWTVQKKEMVVRTQLPKMIGHFAELVVESTVGSAIGFTAAFLGAFSLWDLLWFSMGLGSAYKIGAGLG